MSGRISHFQTEQWLADFERVWAALHYDNPDTAGAYASEIFGGGYTRVLVNFSPPSARATWNLNTITFPGLPAVVVTHVGLWDTETSGNHLATVPLTPPVRTVAGRTLSFGPQTLAISLD